jgi:ribosomal protein S18 acetylase RimI-like enzyme
MVTIEKAIEADKEDIWSIIKAVISIGDTYVFEQNTSKETMLNFWFGHEKHTYIARFKNKVVGTFIIKDNQPGLGSHIANAAYMVAPTSSGLGIGKLMGEYSLVEAKNLGYDAMQFNIVVKSNERAVKLWQKIGFSIIGEIPDAFRHATLGMTNAYIMYRKL